MYSLVIIDDELYMRRAIRSHMDLPLLNLSVSGEAGNGTEGLALLLEQRPDLALVDIDMPVMSGLEMIRRAQAAGCQTRFILLTGYDDFSYAQQAVKLAAADYLLKPVNAQALSETILRCEAEISRDTEITRHIAQLERQNEALMQADFFSSLLRGAPAPEPESQQELLESMGLSPALFTQFCTVCSELGSEPAIRECMAAGQLGFHSPDGLFCVICPAGSEQSLMATLRKRAIPCGVSLVHAGLQELSSAILQSHASLHTGLMDEQVKISDTVKDFIEAHLDDPELSISGIAKGLFLNYSYLCYCFRRDCASTINDYITMRRIEEAKRLFAGGVTNVNLVSQRVGYSSNSYFSRSFKKAVGISPSEFIALHHPA